MTSRTNSTTVLVSILNEDSWLPKQVIEIGPNEGASVFQSSMRILGFPNPCFPVARFQVLVVSILNEDSWLPKPSSTTAARSSIVVSILNEDSWLPKQIAYDPIQRSVIQFQSSMRILGFPNRLG